MWLFRLLELVAAVAGVALVAFMIWREFEDAGRPACIHCGGFLAPLDVATCRGCLY